MQISRDDILWYAFWGFVIVFPKVQYLFRQRVCLWTNEPVTWLQRIFLGAYEFARYWHRYEIHGLEKLKTYGGNCLLVGYHSRCTLDLVYFQIASQTSIIASHLMLRVPVLGWALSQINVLPSGAGEKGRAFFVKALTSKRPLLLVPGGEYECLKPLSKIGQLQWKDVPGFVRLIQQEKDTLGSHTRVIPFHTRNCEKTFYRSDVVYELLGKWGWLSYWLVRHGHVYLMSLMMTCIFIGVGIKILPRPVKLDTYLGDPVVLRQGESAEDFAHRVREATQALIDRVESLPEPESEYSRLRRSNAPGDRVRLYKLCVEMFLVGAYTAIQNTIGCVLILGLIWLPVVLIYYAVVRATGHSLWLA